MFLETKMEHFPNSYYFLKEKQPFKTRHVFRIPVFFVFFGGGKALGVFFLGKGLETEVPRSPQLPLAVGPMQSRAISMPP